LIFSLSLSLFFFSSSIVEFPRKLYFRISEKRKKAINETYTTKRSIREERIYHIDISLFEKISTMNGNEDNLQPVKYLGKVRSLYAHGIGAAIVSIFLYRMMFNE
jgi:CRISPR/Cas system-associated protein Csx1